MMKINAAIVGIGASGFGRHLPDSQLGLAAKAFKAALADSGLKREDIDGLSIHMGSPVGLDYDRVAEGLGLEIRYVNQSWLHGRFVTNALQHAALAVSAGLANVVACVTGISFTRERDILGGPGDIEGNREEGGTHGESPPYGLTAPAGGAALSMQRYMALYGATSEKLAAVPMSIRRHALRNPDAIMKQELTLEAHQASRMVVDPLHLFDCCLITDGAVVTFVTTMERARDMKQKPVRIAGMQGIRSGRDEFIFAPPGLGISQQPFDGNHARAKDQEVYRAAGVERSDVKGLYTYDAFSPLPLFTLERFGFCGTGEAADFVQDGTIGPGGSLPVNTNGGLLSEAHVAGWNHIREMTRQLRGTAGERQIPGADVLQWGTVWGDSVIMTAA
ncbi:thiolase C-terminal domain-containing protein [Zhengella sp. ZM62]|uniref:thiolase C-terminal domain-containing protein n=1 Tax=Zhengella sedimenti TaxID=3390035 RepID=UPI0039752460